MELCAHKGQTNVELITPPNPGLQPTRCAPQLRGAGVPERAKAVVEKHKALTRARRG